MMPAAQIINENQNKKVSLPGKPELAFRRVLLETVLLGLLCIAVLEISFTFAGIGDQEYLKPDRVCGFEIMPDRSIVFRREGFSRTHFNSQGMADRERSIAKSADTYRIAVLGDSIIEALQVDQKKTMCALLEGKLNQNLKGKKKIEVLNFAVGAYNLGQMYLRLKTKVFEFQPDLVLLFVRHHGTYDVIPQPSEPFPKAARPYFFVGEGGRLVEDHTVYEQWAKSKSGKRIHNFAWLREHSRIWGAIGKSLEQAGGFFNSMKAGASKWGADVTAKQTAFAPTQSDAPSEKLPLAKEAAPAASEAPFTQVSNGDNCIRCYYPIVDALIAEMDKESLAHHSEFCVAYMPAHDSAAELERSLIRRTCSLRHIDYLDLGNAFDKAKQESKEALYFVCHFSEHGNRVLADAIYGGLLTLPGIQRLSLSAEKHR
ncbi:MAG: SGNH/GDSL hydrolase family protein [Candidatus Obscuribacterales bacterium]|nr:SGNH/GDSL hydrolase family protein [Candidatus Obscuribacterales bacterium]